MDMPYGRANKRNDLHGVVVAQNMAHFRRLKFRRVWKNKCKGSKLQGPRYKDNTSASFLKFNITKIH